MQHSILITGARIVNEGRIYEADVFIKDGLIEKIGRSLSDKAQTVIDAGGKYLFPGVIDDQVHFREPGLTHKATIYSESKAAVAGGVTTFMEMPNTVPNALTQELLADKYQIASQTSLANYSFFMGASNDNLEEVLRTDSRTVCGIKIFMGSSTGNMLVDNEKTLENIFSQSPMLIATHCEDEATIRANAEKYKAQYGNDIPVRFHPIIRNEEACLKSSSLAVAWLRSTIPGCTSCIFLRPKNWIYSPILFPYLRSGLLPKYVCTTFGLMLMIMKPWAHRSSVTRR
jgi:dihydroorotase